jgi:alanine racemase
MDKGYGAWIEVDLSALEHNYRTIAAHVDGPALMPIIKANGYGLGAVAVAKLYQALGAEILAVTRVEEAIELREAGIGTQILILMPFTTEQARSVIHYNLTPSISRTEQLTELLGMGASGESPVSIHLKLETGLGRTGFNRDELITALSMIEQSEALDLQGIFSHLAVAHKKTYTEKQIQRFNEYLDIISNRGFTVPLIHLANSTAILDLPETHYNLVRPGTILYGQHPLSQHRLDLRDPFKVKAKVLSTSLLPRGSSIGYGLDQVTAKDTRIAVLGLGWADGLALTPERIRLSLRVALRQCLKVLRKTRSSKLLVQIGERKYPLAGRIAMQTAMIMVDDAVQVGDTAVVPMRRLSANSRLPRNYFYQGQQISYEQIEERVNINE